MRREIKRTVNSKLFQIGKNKFHLKTGIMRPLHYLDNKGRLQNIDLRPTDDGLNQKIDKAPYKLKVNKKYPEYRFTSGANSISIRLDQINNNRISERYSEYGNSSFVWKNISYDIDCIMTPRNGGLSTILTLHSQNAAKNFTWEILGSKNLLKPIRGWDARNNPLEINQSWDGDFLTIEWTGRAISKKPARRGEKPFIEPKYPIRIDPSVNSHIAAGADDVSTQVFFGTTLNTAATELAVMYFYFSSTSILRKYAGFLFKNINVPQGATIDSATVTFNSTNRTKHKTIVYGNDVDNAATWSTGNRVINIPKTTAKASFTPTNSNASIVPYTVGITSIIQEIISRVGWSSSNNIGLAAFPNTTSDGYCIIAAYEHGVAGEAELDITYTAGAAPGGDVGIANNPALLIGI